jgi:glycerol uptake facilitator-like aquaporin
MQFIGALVALLLSKFFGAVSPLTPGVFDFHLFAAELMGALFFNFGITAVVLGKVEKQMSGAVVGGSLLLGILIAGALGSAGILNPAVALSLNSFSVVYIFGPVVGAVIGAQTYALLAKK